VRIVIVHDGGASSRARRSTCSRSPSGSDAMKLHDAIRAT